MMSEQPIRTYRNLDIQEIKKHLMVYGDLAAKCENCSEMDVKLDMNVCPSCKTEFTYIAFRNVRQNFPKIHKILATRPGVMIIDYDDFKKASSSMAAKDLFK